ncbi:hypothetical protein GCM10027341_27960 [Spirosoma knui]
MNNVCSLLSVSTNARDFDLVTAVVRPRSSTPVLGNQLAKAYPHALGLFCRELQTVTLDLLQPLLHDLFETNTFWERETKTPTHKRR